MKNSLEIKESILRDGGIIRMEGDDGFRAVLPLGKSWLMLQVSWGEGWDHASVSFWRFGAHGNQICDSCPRWEHMCVIRDLVWEPEETVIQIHAPKSQYVDGSNNPTPAAKYVLHLWRPIGHEIPLPPTWMIGPTKTQKVVIIDGEPFVRDLEETH